MDIVDLFIHSLDIIVKSFLLLLVKQVEAMVLDFEQNFIRFIILPFEFLIEVEALLDKYDPLGPGKVIDN